MVAWPPQTVPNLRLNPPYDRTSSYLVRRRRVDVLMVVLLTPFAALEHFAQERMWEICQEVWDAIPVEVLRPHLLKTEERCKKIKEVDGAWVGWGKGTNVRHGMQV